MINTTIALIMTLELSFLTLYKVSFLEILFDLSLILLELIYIWLEYIILIGFELLKFSAKVLFILIYILYTKIRSLF